MAFWHTGSIHSLAHSSYEQMKTQIESTNIVDAYKETRPRKMWWTAAAAAAACSKIPIKLRIRKINLVLHAPIAIN